MDPKELDDWLLPLCMPLCPLRRPEDENQYIDVDHLAELFARFQSLFPDPARRPEVGHFIVVDGDQGAGKTSLIFRCVHWLKSQSQQSGFTVVNLLDTPYPRNWQPGERALPVFRRMLFEADLLEDDQEALSKVAGIDLPMAFKGLMQKHADTLSVLLGPGPRGSGLTTGEVQEIAGAVAPGMVFFVELPTPAAGEDCMQQLNGLRQSGFPLAISRLSVGKLEPGDGQRMVDGIELLRSGVMPPIPQDIVFSTFRPDDTGLLGLSFYKRLALGSSKLAQHRSSATVDYSDVSRCFKIFVGQRTQGDQ